MFTATLPLLHCAARDPSDRKSLSVVVTSNDQTPATALPDNGVPASIAVGMTMAERHEWHWAYLAQLSRGDMPAPGLHLKPNA